MIGLVVGVVTNAALLALAIRMLQTGYRLRP